MKAFKIVLIVLSVIISIVVVYCWSIGLFSAVQVVERDAGGYHVAGIMYTGPYRKTGKFMKVVDQMLKADGITYSKGFGIYYDNPKTTPEEKCRSFVGVFWKKKDFGKIVGLQSKGFKVDSIPVSRAMVVEFSVKSKMSYMIGPMKAYPAISKYMDERGYKPALSLEVYDVPAKKIYYIMQYNR